ncbi:MAG: SHD1 domain-containing protein, partial [Pirellulaceae bacterium]
MPMEALPFAHGVYSMRLFLCLGLALLALPTSLVNYASARQWSDKTGNYKVEAQLLSFNDSTVILLREDGRKVAVDIDQLSQDDQEFLKSDQIAHQADKPISEFQTWTMRDGTKVLAKVLAYGRKELVVQQRNGKLYFNDQLLDEADDGYKKIIPKIVAEFEKTKIDTPEDLLKWVRKHPNAKKSYLCEGVVLELANGKQFGVPFFLFDPKEMKILEPGWQEWLSEKSDEEERERQSFLLRAQAQAYQDQIDAQARQQQQIQVMQLQMLAVASGVVSMWEVCLYPAPGVPARPMCVIVPARDSEIASQMARAQYPG